LKFPNFWKACAVYKEVTRKTAEKIARITQKSKGKELLPSIFKYSRI
jgi:hypothetical protein